MSEILDVAGRFSALLGDDNILGMAGVKVEVHHKSPERYEYLVGNPPYQQTFNETGASNQIWHLFEDTGVNTSNQASFINPARWVNPRKMSLKIRDSVVDLGVKKIIIFYSRVFDDANVDGGVSINYFERKLMKSNPKARGIILRSDSGFNVDNWHPELKFFANSIEEEFYKLVESYLGTTMLDYKTNSNYRQYGYNKYNFSDVLVESSDGMKRPLRIWANFGLGKQSRNAWYYMERDKATKLPEDFINCYRVMIDMTGHADVSKNVNNIFNNLPVILHPDEMTFSRQYIFKPASDSLDDCRFIVSYMRTRFARMLMYITQKDLSVRGFENVPDYVPLMKELALEGKTEVTDEWLYEKFKVPQRLRDYCEEHISPK